MIHFYSRFAYHSSTHNTWLLHMMLLHVTRDPQEHAKLQLQQLQESMSTMQQRLHHGLGLQG